MQHLLFTLLLLFSGLTLTAQGIGLGVRAGATFANGSFADDDFDSESITGYSFGVLLPISLTENFAIQPEASYVQKGYRASIDFLGVNTESGVYYTYLEIPVLLRASFGPDALKVYLQGGPAFGYAAGGRIEQSINGESVEETIDFEDAFFTDFNRGEVSGIVGAGVLLGGVSGLGIMIDGRYAFGLSDNDGTDTGEYRNQGITLSAGLLFTIGN